MHKIWNNTISRGRRRNEKEKQEGVSNPIREKMRNETNERGEIIHPNGDGKLKVLSCGGGRAVKGYYFLGYSPTKKYPSIK